MPTDPRLGIPYPANTDANDVPRDIKAVVDKIGPIMAADLQGSLSARPAAGVRGRFYTVSGDSSANNGRWFRDDGTTWVELPQMGAWQNWTPTVTADPLASWTATLDYLDHSRYRIENKTCHISYAATWRFTGPGSLYPLLFSLPVVKKYWEAIFIGDAQNGFARVISDQTDTVGVYPTTNWVTDNFGRWIRFDGRYEIA